MLSSFPNLGRMRDTPYATISVCINKNRQVQSTCNRLKNFLKGYENESCFP